VISSDEYVRKTGDVIIAQITSRTSSPPRPGDHRVARWREAGLLAPSLVRARVTTLRSSVILRVLGQMPAPELEEIDKKLASALGLS